MTSIILEDDHWCFACGMENKSGLCIDWKVEGKTTSAEFIPRKNHQGWKDVVHGGILATLLDEAMTRLAWIVCGGALTAEMTVRYITPARIGEKLFIFGELEKENRKIVEMKSCIYKEIKPGAGAKNPKSGILIARAEGKAVKK